LGGPYPIQDNIIKVKDENLAVQNNDNAAWNEIKYFESNLKKRKPEKYQHISGFVSLTIMIQILINILYNNNKKLNKIIQSVTSH